MLLEDVLKEFIFECKMRKLSPRTVQSYQDANLRMMKFIREEYNIKELEETHHLAIKGYIEYQTKQGRAETYINRNIVCYKCFFDYCVKEGYISTNPMDKVNKQKEPITPVVNKALIRYLRVREAYIKDKIAYQRHICFYHRMVGN